MLFKIYLLISFLLALYGVIAFLKNAVGIKDLPADVNSNVVLGLFVRNADNNIEAIVKSFLSKDFKRKYLIDKKLYIVDLGSEDDTLALLEKLEQQNSQLEIINVYRNYDIIDRVFSELESKH